jgi:HD superfamily phosphohydrolase
MKIQDRIYGEVEIKEKVLLDLIESKAITRLGKINQYGAIYQVYPQFFTTRKEHSIGVMLLLARLGASLEEQIAGLLHDVPHTAFSHVIDYVFGDEKMETSYHEVIQKEMLENSDIPEILAKHKLDKDYIFEIHNFSLLERDLPDLCADRVDYILRDLLTYDLLNKEEIDLILNSLIAHEGEIILNNKDAAFLMATRSIKANAEIWSSPYQILLAKTLAEIIKLALDREYITRADLHGTDNKLYRKLTAIEDKEIQEKLKLMTKDIVVTSDDEEFEMHVYTKLRAINPKVKIGNDIKVLSEICEKYSNMQKEYIENHKKGFKLNIRDRKEGELINYKLKWQN